MNICGQEFNFSALNANDLDRMDAAQQHMHAASDREKQRQHAGMADLLRGQCRLVMGYLDEVLGAGASERLGLDGSDFGACTRVMNDFKGAILAEQATVRQAAAVPMNREQRRAAVKQKTDQLIDARQAVDALRDDPDAMQQLAQYALQIAAERHV